MGKTGKDKTVNYKYQAEGINGRGNPFSITLATIINEIREEY